MISRNLALCFVYAVDNGFVIKSLPDPIFLLGPPASTLVLL